MKNTHSRRIIPTLLIAFGLCLVALPSARAQSRSIVGLWDAHFYSGGAQLFETHVQWHSDGLEIELNSIYPGAACMGVYKTENGVVKLHHVVFTYDSNGVLNGYLDETQSDLVDGDNDSYRGTFSLKAYDLKGNYLGVTNGIVRASRIIVN